MKEDLPIPDDLIRIDDYRVGCLLSDSSAGQSKYLSSNSGSSWSTNRASGLPSRCI